MPSESIWMHHHRSSWPDLVEETSLGRCCFHGGGPPCTALWRTSWLERASPPPRYFTLHHTTLTLLLVAPPGFNCRFPTHYWSIFATTKVWLQLKLSHRRPQLQNAGQFYRRSLPSSHQLTSAKLYRWLYRPSRPSIRQPVVSAG